jgi:predicted MFS family arabinose efflux permease
MQRVWVELDLTLLHFGWIWCLLQLVGALAGQGAHAVERLLGSRHAIYAIGLVALAGLLLLGAAMLSWVMVGGVLLFAVRGLFSVCFMDARNRRIDNDYRATINSLLGFGFRLGFIVAASVLGVVFDRFGLNAAVLSLGCFALLVIMLLLVPLARDADSA